MAMENRGKLKGAKSTKSEKKITPEAKTLVLKPVGYPIRSNDEDTGLLTTDDPKLFEQYARSQWIGMVVDEGDFLFDTIIVPDYAFLVEHVSPQPGRITRGTEIILKNYNSQQQVSLTTRTSIKKIHFDNIIGQAEAKKKCRVIMKFLSNPELFSTIWAPRNILFYGPPGTGKTLMAKALANEVGANIFLVKSSDLLGVYVGDGARKIQKLFVDARNNAPSIVFIDEIDAIGLGRKYQSIRGDVVEVVSALLGEMDGIEENKGVITIGATNQPILLDSAIRSRFEEMIEFRLPTSKERMELLKYYSKLSPIPFVKIKWDDIVRNTRGWSGRDLKDKVIKASIHYAILNDKKEITMDDLMKVLQKVPDFKEKLNHYL